MSINAARQTRIKNQIANIDAQIDAANQTLTDLSAIELESYKFDSHEGSQATKRKKEMGLNKLILSLETRRKNLIQQLNCSGVTNMRLDRRL